MNKFYNSLSLRFLVLGIVVAGVISVIAEERFKQYNTERLVDWMIPQLAGPISHDRTKIDQYLKSYHSIIGLMATGNKTSQGSARIHEELKSNPGKAGTVVRRPDWLPVSSRWRGLMQPDFFFLISNDQVIRETMMLRRKGLEVIHDFLSSQMSELIQEGERQIVFRIIEDKSIMFSLAAIPGDLGWLAAVKTIDDRLLSSIIPNTSKSISVSLIIDANDQTLIASNKPAAIPSVGTLEQLSEKWIIGGEDVFDYGNSEQLMRYVMLFPRNEMSELAQVLLNEQKPVLLLMIAIPIMVLMFMAMYLLRRVDKLNLNLLLKADRELGEEVSNELRNLDGNSIKQLEMSVERVSEELVANRNVLKRQSQETRAIFEFMNEGVLAVNSEKRIMQSNHTFQNMSGYSLEDLQDLSMPSLINLLDENMSGQNISEGILSCKDGASIPIEVSYSNLVFEGDKEEGSVWVIHDLRGRIENENKRMELESQLRQSQKMEAIGTLAGGVAHDFNNILQAMASGLDLIELDIPEEHPCRTELDMLKKLRERAGDLVRQILTFSRYDTEKQIRIDIRPIIDEGVKMLRSTLPKNITIQTKVDLKETTIMGNHTQLHQVIVNLCVNAGHAMEKGGGVLTILLEKVDNNDWNPIPPESETEYMCLSISDTGIGIPEEILPRIFDPFFTTKEKSKGTGLGLSVIDGIIEMHKGYIEVESEVNAGTQFKVYFPLLVEKTVTAPSSLLAEKSSEKTRSANILLVDDEQDLLWAQKRTLSRMGHKVEVCIDGNCALDVLHKKAGEFDMVITDQTMPGITGLQLSRKCSELWPDLPIVLSTGYSEENLPESLSDAGIVTLLPKPYTRDVLNNLIQNIVND